MRALEHQKSLVGQEVIRVKIPPHSQDGAGLVAGTLTLEIGCLDRKLNSLGQAVEVVHQGVQNCGGLLCVAFTRDLEEEPQRPVSQRKAGVLGDRLFEQPPGAGGIVLHVTGPCGPRVGFESRERCRRDFDHGLVRPGFQMLFRKAEMLSDAEAGLIDHRIERGSRQLEFRLQPLLLNVVDLDLHVIALGGIRNRAGHQMRAISIFGDLAAQGDGGLRDVLVSGPFRGGGEL